MKTHKKFQRLSIAVAFVIVCFVAVIYIIQLNRTVANNTIGTISEMAEHDKQSIQTYIELCWEDLDGIAERFVNHNYETIEDVRLQMSLECATSNFTHIYLIAEDGRIFTDALFDSDDIADKLSILHCFDTKADKIVSRFDEIGDDSPLFQDSVFYGIRLENFEIDGIKMEALAGISRISSIQDHMVINSFTKNENSYGFSSVIDMNGNYIVDIRRNTFLEPADNMYEHLSLAKLSDLTNEEIAEKIKNNDTFSFYHTDFPNTEILYYFIPFDDDINWYFLMSVDKEVFTEQSRTFIMMSMFMLVSIIVVIVAMLLVIMVSHDKTVRATAKAKAQSEFLSNMSHEIRTPLNGMIGLNHLMMINIENPEQKEQIKEWLKKSYSTANYLLSLVNDVLDMSKLQAGKVDIINEPVAVDAMMEEIRSMQRDNIESRGVNFIVEKDITVPYVETDETRLKQVLMNIVGNAAKFTPKGGHIRLSVSQQKTDHTHVTTTYQCEDSGIGMSEEYLKVIFESFSQEKNKNTKNVQGTGLGMTISKLLVDAMGGEIHVKSKLNVGSTFTVIIPSAIAEKIPDSAGLNTEGDIAGTKSLAERMRNGRPIKILVAEDIELNAEILLEILAANGFEAVRAENGKDAIALFSKSEIGEFDIILMDMQMPVMDGCEAASEIRKLDRPDAKTVIIFACTANTFKEDRDKAMESGMNDFLSKPIDVKVLLKKIGG